MHNLPFNWARRVRDDAAQALGRAAMVFVGSVALSSCVIIPTISQTHLADDIQEKHLSVTAGVEQVIGETPGILPDMVYEYVSYAPTDWFEIGVAGHYAIALIGADFKLDLVDLAVDDSPWSALLMGGAMASPSGGGFVFHGGAGLNYRLTDYLELYATAGVNAPFFVPMFHVGANVMPFEWLSLSANTKVAVNTIDDSEGNPPMALMVSVSPSLNFDLGDEE